MSASPDPLALAYAGACRVMGLPVMEPDEAHQWLYRNGRDPAQYAYRLRFEQVVTEHLQAMANVDPDRPTVREQGPSEYTRVTTAKREAVLAAVPVGSRNALMAWAIHAAIPNTSWGPTGTGAILVRLTERGVIRRRPCRPGDRVQNLLRGTARFAYYKTRGADVT